MSDSQRVSTSPSGAILITSLALMAIGLVMVASTTVSLDRSLFGPGFLHTPFARQLVFVLIGVVLLAVTGRVARPCLASAELRRRVPLILFVVAVGPLIVALVPSLASSHRGVQRWLRWAPGGIEIGFQPSDVAKLALVGWLAWFFTEGGRDPRTLRASFVPAAGAIGLCVLLVGKEDFGTSALLAVVGAAMLLMAGCRFRHLAVLSAVGACGFAALLVAAPYRIARLVAFWNLSADPSGAAYQPRQSLMTIASGGWFGTGLGSGIQKYGYLPECHTDFIFAAICEEMGLLGGGMVIALFGVLIWLGAQAMLSAVTRFERLLAFGVTATIGLQAAMNIAVVTVLTPTTGISLPLISAGGSGLITFCAGIGLLVAIESRGSCAAVSARTLGQPTHIAVRSPRAQEAPVW